ncbi:MAG: radical SAM protein [Bacteroidales bacterium]|nr:radical SAM protein [Bacteroidales bacterium]
MNLSRKPKVLFVKPNYNKYYVTFLPDYEPLVCLLLGACIEDIAEINVFDRRFDTEENLIKTIKEFKPDILATRTHTAGEIYTTLHIMELAKKINPNILNLVGGQHATLLPEDFQKPQVDLICIGPGEVTMREIVIAFSDNKDFSVVKGLSFRQGDSFFLTAPRCPESGIIKWPHINKSYADKYRKHYFNTFLEQPVGFTLTSMGCPYRCKFCSLWVAARGTYRRRTPEEIALDLKNQPYDFVHITDDNTFHNEEHAMEVLSYLKKYNVKKQYLAYARVDTIVNKQHVFEAWKEVGLKELVVGMEACTDAHLVHLNKKTSQDENANAHQILEKIGIRNYAHFIVMPDFEPSDFDRIWKFIDEMNITYPVFVPFTPVPGTPLFFEAKEQKQLSSFHYGYYTLMYMVMKTKMPKVLFYKKYLELYAKTASTSTQKKRRLLSPTYDEKVFTAKGRVSKRFIPPFLYRMAGQILHENTFNYKKNEHKLPPSLRMDYKTDKYYHAATVSELKEIAKVD